MLYCVQLFYNVTWGSQKFLPTETTWAILTLPLTIRYEIYNFLWAYPLLLLVVLILQYITIYLQCPCYHFQFHLNKGVSINKNTIKKTTEIMQIEFFKICYCKKLASCMRLSCNSPCIVLQRSESHPSFSYRANDLSITHQGQHPKWSSISCLDVFCLGLNTSPLFKNQRLN